MENFNKKFTETSLRIGEVRFSYVNVFSPRKNEDGTPGKYSVQLLSPKSNKQGLKMIEEAMEAAKQKGKTDKWGGKIPARMQSVLRDGDEEHPDEEVYEGMMFMNCSTVNPPQVSVRENGAINAALDANDFYSGCWGAAVVNFYPYSVSGNNGVACGLNLVIKTRDDESLGGSAMSADAAFGDMADLSCLD